MRVRVFNAVFAAFPESTSVSVGEDATFFCAGYAQVLVWIVDDTAAMFHDGALYRTKLVNGLRESNLTVLGTVENNNASIKCRIVVNNVVYEAPVVYLTLLGESNERKVGRKKYCELWTWLPHESSKRIAMRFCLSDLGSTTFQLSDCI